MKIRDSGMPEETYWESFFDPPMILSKLELTPTCKAVVEFGCGYGTFTLPAARIVSGIVYALDIDPLMIGATQNKAERQGIPNISAQLCDFITRGAGLPEESMDYAMLFNILHAENPRQLLSEAYKILKPGAQLGIIHWIHDPSTPRGPSLDIRPKPEDCLVWAKQTGFHAVTETPLDLPPYHFGLILKK